MTFQVGDVVRCIEGKNKYRSDVPILVPGELYTILNVSEDDGTYFVQVDCGMPSSFFANRFELATATPQDSLVVRKIKLMEQRFNKRQERKDDYNLAA